MPELTDISEKIISDIRSGGASRGVLGGGVAFGWVGELPPTIVAFVRQEKVDGMSLATVSVATSGTPAAAVAPGAAKPSVTTVTNSTLSLKKFAGMSTFTLESNLTASGMGAVVAGILSSSVLLAIEAEAVAVLLAGAGQTNSAANWTAALSGGQGKVLAAGGRPNLTIVSALDYGAILTEVSAGAGFSQNPESAVGAWFGSPLHVSPKVPSGTAYVIDRNAVVAVENVNSPLYVADALSMANTNEVRVVIDAVCAVAVSSPQSVCKVTMTP